MFALRISTDLTQLQGRLRVWQRHVAGILTDDKLGAAIQSYLIRQTQLMFKAMVSIGDAPATRTFRGVTWRGWATWPVRKYGMTLVEGTRYRWRAYALGRRRYAYVFDSTDPSRGLKLRFKGGKLRRGQSASRAAGRTLERVFNLRASGKKYSDTSNMLQDTGHLRNFTAFIERSNPSPHILALSAGQQVSYFGEQHARRPMWALYPPEDTPAIVRLMEIRLAQLLKAELA